MNPTTASVVLGVGLAWTAAGVTLASQPARRVPGALSIATGAGLLLGAVLGSRTEGPGGETALLLAGAVLGPLTLATHPGPRVLGRWHAGSLIVLGATGALAVLASILDRGALLAATLMTLALLLAAHTWWRVESSIGADQQALVWAATGAVSAATAVFVGTFVAPLWGLPGDVLSWTGSCLIPASFVLGTRDRRAMDPRLVTVRGVVLGGSALTTMAVYVLLTSLVEIVLGEPARDDARVVVAVIAAATFHPTRQLLRGVVDELLFGGRPDPLGAAAVVAASVGEDPQVAVNTIRAALVLPYVAVTTPAGVLAQSGVPQTPSRSLSVPGADAVLVVGLRPGDVFLPDDDAHVLRLAVPLLGLALRAHSQGEQLREARASTNALLAEERRRLRRDLHDGLGPQLSGIAFTADAVDNLIGTDPTAAQDLVRRLRADTATAIEVVRRLAYGMRPPALDELGLVGALEQWARGLRSSRAEPLDATICAEGQLALLPAAIEVAAYRICAESLTNIARHSDDPRANVELVAGPDLLRVTIEDQGTTSSSWVPGVGIHSMRERAQETGGSLTWGPTRTGGLVEALLPLGTPHSMA